MAYSDFDLEKGVTDFRLTRPEDLPLFDDTAGRARGRPPGVARRVPPCRGGNRDGGGAKPVLIFPIFAEARRLAGATFTVLPGVTFDVDRSRGLTGVCDYLFTRSREYNLVRQPVVAVAGAKREDMTAGGGRCAAEMVAVRMFNERAGESSRVVYGCVTTGSFWKFLRLSGSTLSIDPTEYGLGEHPKVLGILVHVGRD